MKINHQGDACFPNRFGDLSDIHLGCGQGFFHNYVLPCASRRNDRAAMGEIRRHNSDGVDLRVAHHLVVIGIDFPGTVGSSNLSGPALLEVTHCVKRAGVVRGVHLSVDPSPRPYPDNP